MSKKTLVIGASLKSDRYSNRAIKKLVAHNNEVVAIGLRAGVVANVEIDTDKVAYQNIDTVSLYLNPKRQADYFDYIISLNPKRVIFNPGTENPEFYKLLEANNIAFEEACTLVLLSINQF
ncbi:CoA-binding protein [Algibacter miyuki]|uniref:CoA-binding protein n=1 Tax=Algibacter miyuki TaxID=1306933 RepID=A0ABV5H1N7_9FLAO|nr:CoA-binding protein [Algibacter miyuki]MDN3666419.1 CoA-binding protein [Algibacter miyuki]